ncbi:MAG: hypothetical protein A2Z17_03275 [Gammaproteobacteria bacterium RBG_16_66_13]|nr:MAG: hypothetical protein A2Z17_03275 [Gammaproteobacteria bacterium RBG_16_66_13]
MQDRGERPEPGSASPGPLFEIRVRGHLGEKWSDWLGDLQVELLDSGEMVLTGRLADQAALMGLLNRLSRLNLTLLSVRQVSP